MLILSHKNIRKRQNSYQRLITDMYWLFKIKFPSLIVLDRRVCKLREETFSFVMSVYLSIKPQGTTRLPLDQFLPNLIFEPFRKSVEKIEVSLKPDKNNGYFT